MDGVRFNKTQLTNHRFGMVTHSCINGCLGPTRGYLVVTVDEILWLTEIRLELESYHVKAEWWGSAKDQQVRNLFINILKKTS